MSRRLGMLVASAASVVCSTVETRTRLPILQRASPGFSGFHNSLTFSDDGLTHTLPNFLLLVFETGGGISDGAVQVISDAVDDFLIAELNAIYGARNRVENVNTTVLANSATLLESFTSGRDLTQRNKLPTQAERRQWKIAEASADVSTEEDSGSSLRGRRQMARRLETLVGSQLEVEVKVTFDKVPAPFASQVEAIVKSFSQDLQYLVSNITATNHQELVDVFMVIRREMPTPSPTQSPTVDVGTAAPSPLPSTLSPTTNGSNGSDGTEAPSSTLTTPHPGSTPSPSAYGSNGSDSTEAPSSTVTTSQPGSTLYPTTYGGNGNDGTEAPSSSVTTSPPGLTQAPTTFDRNGNDGTAAPSSSATASLTGSTQFPTTDTTQFSPPPTSDSGGNNEGDTSSFPTASATLPPGPPPSEGGTPIPTANNNENAGSSLPTPSTGPGASTPPTTGDGGTGGSLSPTAAPTAGSAISTYPTPTITSTQPTLPPIGLTSAPTNANGGDSPAPTTSALLTAPPTPLYTGSSPSPTNSAGNSGGPTPSPAPPSVGSTPFPTTEANDSGSPTQEAPSTTYPGTTLPPTLGEGDGGSPTPSPSSATLSPTHQSNGSTQFPTIENSAYTPPSPTTSTTAPQTFSPSALSQTPTRGSNGDGSLSPTSAGATATPTSLSTGGGTNGGGDSGISSPPTPSAGTASPIPPSVGSTPVPTNNGDNSGVSPFPTPAAVPPGATTTSPTRENVGDEGGGEEGGSPAPTPLAVTALPTAQANGSTPTPTGDAIPPTPTAATSIPGLTQAPTTDNGGGNEGGSVSPTARGNGSTGTPLPTAENSISMPPTPTAATSIPGLLTQAPTTENGGGNEGGSPPPTPLNVMSLPPTDSGSNSGGDGDGNSPSPTPSQTAPSEGLTTVPSPDNGGNNSINSPFPTPATATPPPNSPEEPSLSPTTTSDGNNGSSLFPTPSTTSSVPGPPSEGSTSAPTVYNEGSENNSSPVPTPSDTSFGSTPPPENGGPSNGSPPSPGGGEPTLFPSIANGGSPLPSPTATSAPQTSTPAGLTQAPTSVSGGGNGSTPPTPSLETSTPTIPSNESTPTPTSVSNTQGGNPNSVQSDRNNNPSSGGDGTVLISTVLIGATAFIVLVALFLFQRRQRNRDDWSSSEDAHKHLSYLDIQSEEGDALEDSFSRSLESDRTSINGSKFSLNSPLSAGENSGGVESMLSMNSPFSLNSPGTPDSYGIAKPSGNFSFASASTMQVNNKTKKSRSSLRAITSSLFAFSEEGEEPEVPPALANSDVSSTATPEEEGTGTAVSSAAISAQTPQGNNNAAAGLIAAGAAGGVLAAGAILSKGENSQVPSEPSPNQAQSSTTGNDGGVPCGDELARAPLTADTEEHRHLDALATGAVASAAVASTSPKTDPQENRSNLKKSPLRHSVGQFDVAGGSNAVSEVSTTGTATSQSGGPDGAFPNFTMTDEIPASATRRHRIRLSADGSSFYQTNAMHPLDWSNQSRDGTTDSTISEKAGQSGGERREFVWGENNGGARQTSALGMQQTPSPRTHASMFSGSAQTADTNASSAVSSSRELINDLVWLENKIADGRSSTPTEATPPPVTTPRNLLPPSLHAFEPADSLSFDSADDAYVSPSSNEGDDAQTIHSAKSQSIICRDCFAPPGKLQIIIHSTKDGPAVHTVKPGSCLEGHLYPGDLIIAVDNVDTRSCTAEQVMKMMAAKSAFERKITVLHFEE